MNIRIGTFIPPLLLALLTFLVFCPVLRFQFAPFWDDEDKVLGNPDYHPARIANLGHYWVPPPHETFYVPLTYTVYGLLTMAAGFNPMVFHAANLFCHILSAVFVYFILKHLVGLTKPAWLGAALFAIHPVQMDPVAWIGTLYTPLSSMFGLLAIWMYLRAAEPSTEHPRATDLAADVAAQSKRSVLLNYFRPQSGKRPAMHGLVYAVATIAFILALVAKPSAVVIPVMVAAIEMGLYQRRIRELFLPLGLWGALCVPIVAINRLAYPGNTIFAPPPWQRVIVGLDTIAFYLWKIVWPFHMVPDYGRSPRWVVNHPMVWLTCLVPIAMYIVCRICWRRMPWLGVGFAVFVAGLIPVLGLTPFDFQIYSTPADRYVSLSMLGVAMILAFLLARFYPLSLRERDGVRAIREPASVSNESRPQSRPHPDPLPEGEGVGAAWPLTIVAVLLLGALALRSLNQTSIWRDQWRLFASTLETNPQSKAAVAAFRYLFVDHRQDAARDCTLSPPELVKVGDLLLRDRHSDLATDAYQLALQRGGPNAGTYRKLAEALFQNGNQQGADEALKRAAEVRR